MTIAKRIGQGYASRNGRLADEAVAEAYFWLTHFFKVDYKLWEKSERKEWTLGVYIKRAIMKYFERQNERYEELNEQRKEVINDNTDEEMIEYLSGLTGDENAWRILDLIRGGGFDLFSVELLDPSFRKVLTKLRLEVAGRVKRLAHMQSIGLPTSRDVCWPGKYRGVYLNRLGRYRANVKKDGKVYACGSHDTPEQAAIAYNLKAFELFGADAYQNIVEELNAGNEASELLRIQAVRVGPGNVLSEVPSGCEVPSGASESLHGGRLSV